MLVDELFISGVWMPSSARLVNTTGTPIASAVQNDDGRAISDNYTLTFDSVVASATANVTVSVEAINNPYSDTFPVLLDGATVYKDIIPGLDLVFSSQAGFLNSWEAVVSIGNFLGTLDAYGGGAGIPSTGVRHRVTNDGTATVANAKASLLPIVKWVKMIGDFFNLVRPFAIGATEKTAGGGSERVLPYILTIGNVAGSGAGKTVSLSIDGALFGANSLLDVATGITQNGNLIKAVAPPNVYKIVSGALTGFEFAIAPGVANSDKANVLIFAPRYGQIAPDVAGLAGTYGTNDVNLTQSGLSTGEIESGGVAYFWQRALVPNGADAESNPYPLDIDLSAIESGQAGWWYA